jgi:hypothetical protein
MITQASVRQPWLRAKSVASSSELKPSFCRANALTILQSDDQCVIYTFSTFAQLLVIRLDFSPVVR